MDDKRFIGMYHNDSELMTKIDDLKNQGIDGENIYVIAQDDSDVTMFQGMKYGDVQTTPESWFDRFMNFLTGENHVRSMLREVNVPDSEMDNYYNEILNGGKLLYVDEGEINTLHGRAIATSAYWMKESIRTWAATVSRNLKKMNCTAQNIQPALSKIPIYMMGTMKISEESEEKLYGTTRTTRHLQITLRTVSIEPINSTGTCRKKRCGCVKSASAWIKKKSKEAK